MTRAQTASVNGFEMYYETRGEGEPLFLLHGMNGSGADWDLVFPKKIEGYRTIVPDLRGHGRSTNPSGAFTIRQCALDVLELARMLGVRRCKAIGLSLGGNVLLHVATMQPELVEAMVIVSATPYFTEQCRGFMDRFAAGDIGEAELEVLRRTHVRGDAQIDELRRYVATMRDGHDDMSFTPPALATIAARTLVVHGDSDPLYPVEIPVVLFHAIPSASLWIVPQGGHGPIFLEHAASFAATALGFLRA